MFSVLAIAALIVTVPIAYYLTGQIRKFSFIKKLSRGSTRLEWIYSAAIVLLAAIVLTLCLSTINALICLLILSLAFALCSLAAFIISRLERKSISSNLVGTCALCLAVSYLAFGFYSAHNVIATEYMLKSEKDVSPLKIVQISDAHIGTTLDADDFAEEIAKISELSPDLVLVTGDFVDDATTREDMLGASRAFSLLHTTYGVYFTYGNHDKGYFDAQSRGWSSDELVSALEASGVTILEDEAVEIGKDYYLVGRQDASVDRTNRRRATMAELIEPLDKDRYIIVMDHQPTDYDAQAEAKVDLVLSGHTHGGQILGVSYLGELAGINCNTYGHERRQMTDFIVTSGIGTWEIKFKPSSPAEYVIIDISK